MKKFTAVLMAVIMAAAFVPAAFAGAVSAEDVSVTYTGATVNAANLSVGNTFYFTLDVSANSRMWSGHWYIDYPEQFVTPTACSTTWSGGVIYQINQSIANDNQTSDMPNFIYRLEYEGQTGNNPYGEAGNMYSDIGMYLTSFDFGGMNAGGSMARFRFRIDAIPSTSICSHDSNGYYLEFPIIVRESRYWVPNTQIAPDVDYYRDHEQVNVVNGKVYFNAVTATVHTVTFYDYDGHVVSTQQVQHGLSATAPTLPQTISNSNGVYRFFGWDVDYTNVTANLSVHPVYVLVGDTDLNGTVNALDALLAMRKVMNLTNLTDKQIFAGNVDNDSNLTTNDALMIMRFAMNLIDTF
ncbi:MAG: dockerin type I repeat-containing protein [Clostridia bacterium]|nr:dockerin type I repeat-containing protein [Clostridia bacterium]